MTRIKGEGGQGPVDDFSRKKEDLSLPPFLSIGLILIFLGDSKGNQPFFF